MFFMQKERSVGNTEGVSVTKKLNVQCELLINHLKKLTHVSELPDESKKLISNFTTQFKLRWQSEFRNYEYFTNKNRKWLDSDLSFPVSATTSAVGARRRILQFSESSERSKSPKTVGLRSHSSPDELSYATQMSL